MHPSPDQPLPGAARLLRESNRPGDLEALDRAWSEPATFAFLPGKSSIDEAWVRDALAALPEDLARDHFCLLTSGSTGRPKLVIGERRRAELLVDVLHVAQDSEDTEEAILTLPLSYCYAFVNQWLWARRKERRLVWTGGLGNPEGLRTALDGATNAMLCLVGAQLPLLASQLGEAAFSGIRRVHFAGGPFPQAELESIQARFPRAEIFNNYGCAEAMPRLTLRRAGDAELGSNVGQALPGVELKTGGGGELLFRSAYRAVAFHDDGGLSRIDDGEWIPTGDLGGPAQDGSWELQGRANQVFKRFGEKISILHLTETVESAGWAGSAQFYREADRLGEEGCVLLIAPTPDAGEVRQILKALRARHPRTHWPLRVESIERMPCLPNGKTDLASLASAEGKVVHWRNRI